ncbi:DUF3309 family protein [Mesorhizobium sp. AD1-1]|nr:DUF3309 family protein [Mesorhizobium sp. AD1-1]MBZ9720457.1 DUF3309 family protein [Mesorhizobium sp. AD1-1]
MERSSFEHRSCDVQPYGGGGLGLVLLIVIVLVVLGRI